ncbi:hypothetical protein GF386_03130 [Candidatus Pacearchaeota archaeon]|nr:hypothetical protein [Candidatus Pacearchaeota archaeon]MBD3283133.1 hypothetical protein [Candidatus Pacearchaeota archaeon]
MLFEKKLCLKCRGRGFCGKPCRIYSKINWGLKTRKHFSGNSPPEIFIGRFNYPDINAGILSPNDSETGDENTEELAMPEIWHKSKFSISHILDNRGKLIYGRFKTKIRNARIYNEKNKFLNLMQEICMAYKPVSTEFLLKKPPSKKLEISKNTTIIGNPAPLKKARIQENPKVKPKVDYLVSDTDCKSVDSIKELYKSKIPVTHISKILSAGLLGIKTNRKLVPTRWSITATDDTLSKNLLKKIKYYPEINEILLFHSYYNGNHYEILLLPDRFSFEVIEAETIGSLWNQTEEIGIMQDYEFFHERKKYAYNTTGAYYANRLALCEYLEFIKKQATALFIREVRPEYYAPLGVGILRETCRAAFQKKPEKFQTLKEALQQAQTRLKLPIKIFTDKSAILKEYGKQTRLNKWI